MNSGSAGAGRPDALDIGERGTALAGAPPAQEAEGGQRPGVRARVTPAQGTGSGRGESGGLPQVRDARRAPGCPHSPGTKLGLRQRPLGKRGGGGLGGRPLGTMHRVPSAPGSKGQDAHRSPPHGKANPGNRRGAWKNRADETPSVSGQNKDSEGSSLSRWILKHFLHC